MHSHFEMVFRELEMNKIQLEMDFVHFYLCRNKIRHKTCDSPNIFQQTMQYALKFFTRENRVSFMPKGVKI